MSAALAIPTLAAQRRQLIRNDQLSVRSNLNGEQDGLELGQSVPIVFGRRVNGVGGVWLSPPATECRFENDTLNRVTASYHLVLCDGQLGTIPVGDVYQGDTWAGSQVVQAYDTRAGSWLPGNFIQQRFNVTTTSRTLFVEGKAIGNDAAGMLDLGGLDSPALAQLIQDRGASVQIKSSGNYVTSFEIDVNASINWPQEGAQAATRGVVTLSLATGTPGETSTSSVLRDVTTLPWILQSDPASYADGVTSTSAPRVQNLNADYGQVFTVGNSWVYDRGEAGRYMPTELYQVTRPASAQPYGALEFNLQEVIRPGFIMRETLPGISLFGGLPPVTYQLVISETNSEPYPKPEATLYCGTGGSYDQLTTLSVTKQYPSGEGWKRQIHVFLRNGEPVPRLIEGTTGPSNLFPDLARRLLRASALVPDELIDDQQLLAAAQFNDTLNLRCNGLVANPSNVRELLDRTARLFLLTPTNRWGRIGLRPAVATTGSAINTSPITPVMVFDENNIVPGSLSVSYVPRSDRVPRAALVMWRDQPENDLGVMRSTEVRYAGEAVDGPYDDIDGSDLICAEAHASMVGALPLARRRHITHSITLQALPTAEAAALLPGSIIRVNRARRPTVGASSTWSYLYEVSQITGPPLGPWTIQATHFPVDSAGRSLIALDLVNMTLLPPA
jgi:hypothetical protein